MKLKLIRKSCVGVALLLAVGMFSGTVMAKEQAENESPSVIVINEDNGIIDAHEMKPGDVATEFDIEPQEGLLQVNSAFTPRLTAPESGNPYYFDYNSYYLSGYGMPNCTAYAYGRAYEILGSKPSLCMGNANQWWGYNLNNGYYEYGSTPKVGAVICWGGWDCGHVAVVEKIEGDKVTYSESTWSGVYFQTRTYTIGNEDNTSVGDFQGYIYLGDFSADESSDDSDQVDNDDSNDDISDDTSNVIKDTTAPVISELQITNIDEAGFTVTCNVSDEESGIDKVLFPVWTQKNDQDDLIWYTANVVDGIASKRIAYEDHNQERDTYNIHVYAYDGVGLSAMTGTSVTVPAKMIDVSYRTHVQNIGWQGWKENGDLSGTVDEAKRLEGIEINLDDQGYDVGIAYATHIENIGWQDFRSNGEMSGTEGRGLRLEAIRIELTGADATRFDVYYRVHAQNIGWLDWASNGADSGTAGFGYRLEAVEIRVVPKGAAAPGQTARAYVQSV